MGATMEAGITRSHSEPGSSAVAESTAVESVGG